MFAFMRASLLATLDLTNDFNDLLQKLQLTDSWVKINSRQISSPEKIKLS